MCSRHSEFSPLTEALARTLGLRRGAEELPRHLNQVYDALIAEVDRYGGSVIGFAGDAITCWFEDPAGPPQAEPVRPEPAALRATACGLSMQEAIRGEVVVALFMRFAGIDYDADEAAGVRLDAYIRRVQGVIAHYEGTLIQLTIGEKGNYLYAAFGAPIAHEDDALRAVSTARTLRDPPAELDFIQPVQIGICRGTMRTGTYGGTTRRTYGSLGDQVNLAARLMQYAQPGQVIVSRNVPDVVAGAFTWELLPAIRVKGKSGGWTAFRGTWPGELQGWKPRSCWSSWPAPWTKNHSLWSLPSSCRR